MVYHGPSYHKKISDADDDLKYAPSLDDKLPAFNCLTVRHIPQVMSLGGLLCSTGAIHDVYWKANFSAKH